MVLEKLRIEPATIGLQGIITYPLHHDAMVDIQNDSKILNFRNSNLKNMQYANRILIITSLNGPFVFNSLDNQKIYHIKKLLFCILRLTLYGKSAFKS